MRKIAISALMIGACMPVIAITTASDGSGDMNDQLGGIGGGNGSTTNTEGHGGMTKTEQTGQATSPVPQPAVVETNYVKPQSNEAIGKDGDLSAEHAPEVQATSRDAGDQGMTDMQREPSLA